MACMICGAEPCESPSACRSVARAENEPAEGLWEAYDELDYDSDEYEGEE